MSRILLVDDDPIQRLRVEELLAKIGHQVSHCASIAEARRALPAEDWDALLLDQHLPDGEGLDLLADLRRQANDIPVILVTGVGSEEVAARALRAGADDYLTKDTALAYLEALPHVLRQQLERVELRRANETLQEQVRQREHIEALRDVLVGLADKLNNRLTGTIGFLELIALSLTPEHAQLRQQIEQARDSAQRSAEILRTLLAYTVGLEQMEVRCTPVADLLRPLRECHPETCPDARGQEDLPAPFACDLVGQALLALVRNAVEASGGTQGVRVGVGPSPDGLWLEVRVDDRGEGIAAENLHKVTLPFFTTRGTRPAGLGLWTAYQVMRHVGGRLSIASEPGRGTSVKMDLPLAVQLERGEEARGEAPA